MKTSRALVPIALAAVSAFALAGCAGTAAPAATTDDARVQVVASTDVYGQIVEEIGGDRVAVTSIITSASQDPHSYEASAQDQLTVSGADLIVENGGGYDAFVDALIESSGSTAPVITAAEYSHDWPGADGHDHADETADPAATDAADDHAEDADHDHTEDSATAETGDDHAGHDHVEGFNEHVWYDPHTMEHLTEAIVAELSAIDPDGTDAYTANAATFTDGLAGLEDALAAIEASDAGAKVFVTEPVPGYLIAAAGLDNVTPDAFSEAVEEGQDVAPATLLESLQLIQSGDVRVVIVNAQTGGAETDQVVAAADAQSIPVLKFAETLPEGQTYLSWMDENIAALADALTQ